MQVLFAFPFVQPSAMFAFAVPRTMACPTRSILAAVLATVATVATPSDSASAQGTLLLEQPPREIVFRLESAPGSADVDLMLPLRDVTSERLGPVRNYTLGPWGDWTRARRWRLSWRPNDDVGPPAPVDAPLEAASSTDGLSFEQGSSEPGLEAVFDRSWMSRYDFGTAPTFDTTGSSLETDGFASVFRLPPVKPVVDWRCKRKPPLIARAGGEGERFELLRCDGSLAPESLDRLSLLARPPASERPSDLLPDEPEADAWKERREWIDGVRLVHPRLVWALHQLSGAFPGKAIIIYSGYRPFAEVNDASRHKSLHAEGRALDIAVHKITTEDLFRACTKLRGIGCGFYPHQKFIHVDVRRAGAGEAFYVDASAPGEPAKYVTDFPGLVQNGRLVGVRKTNTDAVLDSALPFPGL